MFDPSKLNLDLDNLDENNSEENKQDSNKNPNKSDSDTKTNQKQNIKNDILEDINNQEKQIKKDSVLNDFNNPLLKEEDKKQETNTEEQDTNENKTIKKQYTKKEKNKIETPKEEKIIYDINLNSVETLIAYLVEHKYDFLTIVPSENNVKIDFFSDKILRESKYIQYPIYSKLLIKIKSNAKLKIEETEKDQEWKWEIILKNKTYKILVKTVSSNLWEKIFLKAIESQKKPVKKQAKKTSIWSIFWFLWAIIFIWLVLWWSFISFVVMNAKTVEDVKFFYRLWINLNDINNFIETAIWIIFSIIVLFEILSLIIFLFKFLFTKKEFKKQRITRWVISFIILIITFITVSSWMYIDKKIKSLPNWQELAYWNIQLLDNDVLNESDMFNREAALLKETTNLIWPINIKFDITNLANSEKEKWIKINKYIWNFWWDKDIITLKPSIIKNFNEKWNYKVRLMLEEIDLHWDTVDKKIENIPSIEISNTVKITEEKLNNWWKIVKFDASNLKNLWKINWFFITKEQKWKLKPVYTWYNFNPAKVIFEDTVIWMQINNTDKQNDNIDKIFIIKATKQNNIKWSISEKQDPIDDLTYTFEVKNINSDFWDWFIQEFKWHIDNIKTKTLKADIDNLEKSSIYKIKFKKYWKHTIKVDLKDSNWNIKTLEKEINIKKNITLDKPLEFINNNKILDNIEYQGKTHEYFIKNLKAPTILTISAKNIESDNILDYLYKVQWDIWWDWDIDSQWKVLKYDVKKWWSYQVDVIYTFQNKRIKTQFNKLKETIYIDAETKEKILDFKIKKPRDYAPVKVAFDASNSYIKWKNISKFIYDYWDWTPPDVRDAINPWHRYLKPWNYTVKLTVVTSDWKEYSTKKSLVLKPQPQKAEITLSMNKVPTYTPIDFSSSKSTWEISNYFWDFGDWKTSTEANPSHSYKNSWTYNVKLIIDYKNKNTLSTQKTITVTDE